MARMARIVIPNIPHHITQRGNRSQKVFFSGKDKTAYLNLLHKHAQDAGLTFWAYCLMDNHVHLIAVPEKEDSLAFLRQFGAVFEGFSPSSPVKKTTLFIFN